MRATIKRLSRINWSAILIPLLVGCPFLCIGLSEIHKTAQVVNAFAAAHGTVIGNTYTPFAEGGAAYVPVVEFQTRDEQVVRFTDGIGTYPAEYEVGTRVNVLYDPQDVQNARVSSWKRLWFAPTLITSVGALPILIGIGLAWIMRRR